MKTYRIPVVFQMVGYYDVVATCLEEAIEKIEDKPLPVDKHYIDDSLEIDYEGIRIFPEEG